MPTSLAGVSKNRSAKQLDYLKFKELGSSLFDLIFYIVPFILTFLKGYLFFVNLSLPP